ncbi:hypothetical protein ABCR94_16755 [Streptomyces sp. 21So2-11]|uniref:hypothetical protein n=1 Tax=Streptomyces sp. 21So2-11 TaxID=3144408 RepID=UPI003219738A
MRAAGNGCPPPGRPASPLRRRTPRRFRLTPTGAVRIADRYQDTMGFTVTGPRTFLASGRPSPADPTAASPHLGLIRSTDAGQI